ncbi:MAG: molybdenum cofactor guanylyltransferase [Chloroflexi bacterium]|nr:molybdenum cofactor guanylyltransferase [Chloroflexota bacterium]MCI0823393.1 molybdenum cofactor guanylyltransferase [Chloroflexota bacterium]
MIQGRPVVQPSPAAPAVLDADALVLAGGRSRRMGTPKASLPINGVAMIESVLRVVEPIFRRTLVVARPDIALPSLEAEVVFDQFPDRGPLAGLISGLQATTARWCFVTGCDMPFLDSEVIRLMAGQLEGAEVVAVRSSGRIQPLHAFYHRDCLGRGESLLREGVTSLMALHDRCQVKVFDEAEFAGGGRLRRSLWDLDTPEEYAAALAG